jgi:hypothetical protein
MGSVFLEEASKYVLIVMEKAAYTRVKRSSASRLQVVD